MQKSGSRFFNLHIFILCTENGTAARIAGVLSANTVIKLTYRLTRNQNCSFLLA